MTYEYRPPAAEPARPEDPRWIRAVAAGYLGVLDEEEALEFLATARPELAKKLFAGAAYAIREVDDFTEFVAEGGAPTGAGVYASTTVACVGDILAHTARKEATK